VCFSLHLSDYTVEEVVGPLEYTMIYVWDAQRALDGDFSDGWLYHARDRGGTLKEFKPDQGVIIHTTKQQNLHVEGYALPSPRQVGLKTSWNLLCYGAKESKTPAQAMGKIVWKRMFSWDASIAAASSRQGWLKKLKEQGAPLRPPMPPTMKDHPLTNDQDLNQLDFAKSYWVQSTGAQRWDYQTGFN